MDPITSGLTILQLVQTIAQASALLYGYVASVRDADSSCQTLLDELSAILGVLTTVMEIEKDPSLPDNLRRVLSKLMAEYGPVMKLQGELKNLLPNEQESKAMGKMSKLMWPFKEKKAAAIAERLKGFYRDITTVLAIDSRNTLKDVDRGIKEVGRDVKEVGRGVQELKEIQEAHKIDEECRKLLEWMNPVSCIEKHDISCRQRNPETARWIFHTDQYMAWDKSERAFLWLNGQPGSGKTILASAVIDEIQGGGEQEPQMLAYFYCNFRDDRTTSAAAVLRSLIVQLLRQCKNDDWITKIHKQQESNAEEDLVSLRKLWKQQSTGESCPTDLGYLRKLIVEASTLVHRPALFIDALDECKDYPDLIGHLASLAEDGRLRLFVTSRSEPDIQEAFYDLPTVSLKDSAGQMKEDINVHITEQLKNHKRLSRLPGALKTTILERLLEKAEGMFRWVQCQLDEIVTCKRHIDIETALDNLPEGLYETYDRIIQAIKQRGRSDNQIAQSCLLWLAGALSPLALDQLNEAIMIEVGESNLNPKRGVIDPMDIVTACGSLVTYDEKTGVVALSHYSVKEYLINRPNNIFKSTSDMHARICKLLITYVLCDFVDEVCANDEHPDIRNWSHLADVSNVSKDHPLLSYAIQGWKHLRHVSDHDSDIMNSLSRLNAEFLRNTKKHHVLATQPTALSIIGIQHFTDGWLSAAVTSPSCLHISLEHGKPWMVEFVIKQHPHLLEADIAPSWGSPLIFAIAKNPDCLGVLLKLGVDLYKLSFIKPSIYFPLTRRLYDTYYAPIVWAAATGNEVVVDFLLSHTEGNLPDDTLHMAVRAEHPSHESIRKLRQRGADVNFTVYGFTPIHYFLSDYSYRPFDEYRNPSPPVVKALVEPSCNLSLQDRTARTALHIALDGHMEDIVAYLLEKNAGLSATGTLHPDMWSWATNKPWFPKVQAAVLAADSPCTRIKGKVVHDSAQSRLVEFPVSVTVDPNPICAFVVSASLNGELRNSDHIDVDLSYCNQSLDTNIQDSPKDDSPRLRFQFSWFTKGKRVSSRLFDYHQEDQVIRMLRRFTKDTDSTGTSLFLRMSKEELHTKVYERGVECTLDIYRGPLPES